MRLHWFREHKNIVYWLLLPGVGIGLVFFGLTGRGGGALLSSPAPSIQYTVGNKSFELSPSEVLQLRNAFLQANLRGHYDPSASIKDENNASSWAIGYLMAECETARQQGFEVGREEMNERLRNVAIAKIKQIDRITDDKELKLTRENYDKLLAQLNLSDAQFRSMVHDLFLRDKFRYNIQVSMNESDPAEFSKFAQRKENVRIRYKTFKSTDFMDKTKQPTDDEIKAFYDGKRSQQQYDGSIKETSNHEIYSDIFKTEPELALEAVFYKDEDAFKDLGKVKDIELMHYYDLHKIDKWKDPSKVYKAAPDAKPEAEKEWKDAELKKYYEAHKAKWPDPANAGQFKPFDAVKAEVERQWQQEIYKPFDGVKAEVEKEWKESELKRYYDTHKSNWPDADPAKVGQFKPLESVKAEVEKLWQEDRVKNSRESAKSNIVFNVSKTLRTDLEADEKKFTADPANKDKKFNVETWLTDHKFTRWTTPLQTEDKYKDGKLEVKAPNLSLGKDIFNYSRVPGRMPPSAADSWKKHMDEFTSLNWIDQNKPELGGIAARKLTFNEPKLKTLEEAKPKIIEYLRTVESVKLAKTAADEWHDKWAKFGKDDKVNWDELDEITSDKKEYHPLVTQLKDNPRAVGEVMDVATGSAERDEKDKEKEMTSVESERKWQYVGVVVERKLPTVYGFKKSPDADWNRSQQRQMTKSYDGMAAMLAMLDPIHGKVIRIGTMADPDLRTVFNRADE